MPRPIHARRLLAGATLLLFCAVGAVQAAPAQAGDADRAKAAQIHRLMAHYHQLGQLDGTILVAERGKVVYQRAFGLANREWKVPNTVDTSYRIASLTKQFTAAMVMQLVEQGKVRLDDQIGKYVPELRPEVGGRVTIHQLLNHSSGVVDYANFPGFWANRLGERVPRADLLAIMNRDLDMAPGSAGRYSSSGYTLLGWMIERQTGKSYGQALDEMIVRPLGMRRSGYDTQQKVIERMASGYVRALGRYQPAAPLWVANIGAGGGMVASAGDLLLWDRALYGSKLLSEQSKRLMFTPYVKDDVWGDLGYGYGWMIGQREIGGRKRLVHEHGGNANGFRTLITRYPEEQRLVVILLNEGNGNKGKPIYEMGSLIANVMYGVPAPLPKPALADALVRAIDRHGLDAALAGFAALRAGAAPPTDPNALNNLGYAYAMEQRFDQAVAVLKLNAGLFPADANTYDSIGEVSLMRGDTAAAIANYRRALELDPNNTNAAEVLRKLGAQ